MKLGTPGFISERLRSARFARGMTAQTLAELTGVTPAAVSQYENGHQSPSPEVMFRICDTLNFPKSFFCEPREDLNSTIFFRSFKTATKHDRLRSHERLRWVLSSVNAISERISLPRVNIPDFSVRINTLESEIDESLIEELANEVRRTWSLTEGPISNLAWLLENQGAIVIRHEVNTDKVDAFSCWPSNTPRPIIILSTNKRSACRSRFDIAHELGHLVLHRNISPANLSEKDVLEVVERQADFFAGALLMPAAIFRREIIVPDLNCFLRMKKRWNVSVAMMIMRVSQLRLLTERQLTSLWRQFSARRWKKREPLDDEIPVEQPKIIELCFERFSQMNQNVIDEFLQRVRLRPQDIESALGLRSHLIQSPESNEVDAPSISVLKFPNH